DLAYVKLAYLDPWYGLCDFVAPLVYDFMGTSIDIAIGLVAVVSLLLGSLLSSEISDTKSHDYVHLYCAFMNGYHSLGFFKNFQSHAVITIALQQLKGLLDIKDFTTKSDIFSVMHLVW
ncbi:hypothetical protein S83_001807, partial [Arachis hypogaea]